MNIDEMYERIVKGMKEYIFENYSKPVTLNDLADKYYITCSYLSKIFKIVTGTTFKKYLYIYRINQAKRLLLSDDYKSIAEISKNVGFRDVCYFYRVFQKLEGMNPTEFVANSGDNMRKVV